MARLTEDVLGPHPTIALVATGGYGRGDLSPHSDVDLLLLVRSAREVPAATVRGLLYPLWDAGFEVGHAVRTPKEGVERAGSDLDAATALLSSRFVAGERDLYEELVDRRRRWLAHDAKSLTRRINIATQQRHAAVERAGWVLAPHLKEDAGGLRDVHRAYWLSALSAEASPPEALKEAEDVLLATREALHAHTNRRQDRIHIDLQPAVARVLGIEGDDAPRILMHELHSAARLVEHHSALFAQELTARLLGGPKRSGSRRVLGSSTRLDDGTLKLHDATPPSTTSALELLARRAHLNKPVSPQTIGVLATTFAEARPPEWKPDTLAAFLDLLRGPHVVDALELIDHTGGWRVLIPEWLRVRALAQHDPYHRYTVDAHLFVTVAELATVVRDDPVAARAATEVGDLDDLRLAALLHDIGKGSGEDHSVAGERLARAVCARIGMDAARTERVARLVRHHLTLVDTATRRDLDDGGVIAAVADAIPNPDDLRLLYILTVADGRATGPDGWSEWKAALVRDLYKKTLIALETGALPTRSDVRARAEEVEAFEPGLAGRALDVLETLPPSYVASTHLLEMVDDLRLLLQPPRRGDIRYRVDEGTEPGQSALTVCITDRPGALARTAGVLSLHRLSVLRAQAFSSTRGLALQRFVVGGEVARDWRGVAADLEAAYSGRLALEARLERKIREYGSGPVKPQIRVLQETSEHSTVIEVRSGDALGLLYGIAAALGDLDLDIHVAKIDTLGSRVVDVFYVRDAAGAKLAPEQVAEVRRAVAHRLARLYGA
ncbi:MAG: [protein-PII] uridylyltransferase [Actinomycetota bacterium]|nr:[protein-PII] uridylyltransferase [Actinomycetota bacterium]